ncbi:MAG TPA: hypothetical protein VFT84_11400 [Gemmatimonadales bacterium]|nr:hypothetical protein [Gemmatimonadales bacterium]
MTAPRYGPSTTPVAPRPSPLLLFIEQAQLTLVYAPRPALAAASR